MEKKDSMKSTKLPVAKKSPQVPGSIPEKIGEYKLLKLVGKGAFGNIFEAKNKSGKLVAIKELQATTDSKEAKRIQNEILVLKTAKHKNIVELYDVFTAPSTGSFYLVMEYCTAGDLRKYQKSKGNLNEFEVQEIIFQIADGLKELYSKKIMHRDLKLENILRTTNEKGDTIIKIADFGLSRFVSSYAKTICGTLFYMAPEIIQGYFIKFWNL